MVFEGICIMTNDVSRLAQFYPDFSKRRHCLLLD